jgi:hypothetical protein
MRCSLTKRDFTPYGRPGESRVQRVHPVCARALQRVETGDIPSLESRAHIGSGKQEIVHDHAALTDAMKHTIAERAAKPGC